MKIHNQNTLEQIHLGKLLEDMRVAMFATTFARAGSFYHHRITS